MSQAVGKDDTDLVIAYMNRGRMVLLAIYIPLAFILWWTESILLYVG